jgi:hypothetical protein
MYKGVQKTKSENVSCLILIHKLRIFKVDKLCKHKLLILNFVLKMVVLEKYLQLT